ncbi:MAG: peptidylprolyl isomerase [Flavobacteriales bacterium]|nr:peptidylprolyl isomerase [Flavobacteriales bacterium]
MALVGKIREKSGLIVFIVGLGLFLFIIPFDSIYSFFGGGGEQPIGEVFGKPVYDSKWNFNQRVENYYANYQLPADYPEEYRLRDERDLWQQLMYDTIIKTEIGKIGLQVSAQEIKDYLILGENPSPIIKEMFSFENAQGQKEFKKDSVIKVYNQWVSQLNAATGDQKAGFSAQLYYNIELPIKEQRLKAKYNAMIKYGVVGTLEEANKKLIAENASVTVSFVAKEVNTVPDSSVKVSEEMIKSYYEAHKEEVKWRQEDDKVALEFVKINVEATEADKNALYSKLEEIKSDFASAKNDTSFINAKSDTQIGEYMDNQDVLDVLPYDEFDPSYTPFDEVTNEMISKGVKGDVIGPFSYVSQDGQAHVVLAKVRDNYSREETQVRHILILTQGVEGPELTKKKNLADSIKSVLAADKSKFALLGTQFSEDPGFASNKGYYNVYPDAPLVPEFKDFGLQQPIGTVGVVKTTYGYHVMEVVERRPFDHQFVAYIEKNVVPTEDTRNEIFENIGFGFVDKARVDYEAALEEFALSSTVTDLFLSFPYDYELGYNAELVNWAFSDKRVVGDISTPIELKDGNFVVAKINAKTAFGVPSYETVKEDMKIELLKEEKLKYIVNKAKDAKSLDDAEKIFGGSGIMDANLTLSGDGFNGFGADPIAVAKTFLVANTNEFNVVEGNQGVYFVVIKERKITPVSADKSDAIASLTAMRQSYMEGALTLALFKSADVRDWRMKTKVYYANRD